MRVRGFLMVLVGACLWGISGTVAQKLFRAYSVSPEWLVAVRMCVSGLLLLVMVAAQGQREAIWGVWKQRRDAGALLVFGLVGMLGVQYTFFAAIDTGNAALATLLQSLAPLLIMLYVSVRYLRLPSGAEFGAIGLALAGTYLLVTNGSSDGLSVSVAAVVWGISCALAMAFYTLQPSRLMSRWHSAVVVGWGMLIGGIGMSFVHAPWDGAGMLWSGTSVLLVLFVILFGTLVPFYLYMDSMRYIKPTETSVLACAEPLAAMAATALWLHVPLGLFEVLGGLCIIMTVVVLSKATNPVEQSLSQTK